MESELHLLECKSTQEQLGDIGDAQYEDIFSTEISRQEKITKIFEKVIRMRYELTMRGDSAKTESLVLSSGPSSTKFSDC